MMNQNQGKTIVIAILGWYGVIAIVLAYGLLSFSVIASDDLRYQFLNLTGSLGIVIETYSRRDYQPLVINVLWLLIAFMALISLLR